MTSLPFERRKSPLCEAMIFISGWAAIPSSKPFLRSIAGALPGVPCSSTIAALPPSFFAIHSAAILPSATKSDAISVV